MERIRSLADLIILKPDRLGGSHQELEISKDVGLWLEESAQSMLLNQYCCYITFPEKKKHQLPLTDIK